MRRQQDTTENPRSHTRKPSTENAQHTPWTWHNQPWSQSKKAVNHLDTALHPTTSRPWRTQIRSNEQITEKRSSWRSRGENTDYYWGIPGHKTVSFSSLQKKNTQIIFTFFNMCLMSSAMAYEAALRLADPNSVQSFSYWGIFFTLVVDRYGFSIGHCKYLVSRYNMRTRTHARIYWFEYTFYLILNTILNNI